jgi:hypothetical protein
MRTRDPVYFWSLDPGWLNQDLDLGSGMNIPDHFSESLKTIFWVKNTEILSSGSEIFFTRAPGWKNSDPG